MSVRAQIYFQKLPCGVLEEEVRGRVYHFTYAPEYQGPMISLTMPVRALPYTWDTFPAFFDGLLPEGVQLEALLRIHKIDRDDYMGQLMAVGEDLVGAISVRPMP